MTTVHANSPEEALWRLETLALSAGVVSETAIVRQLEQSVDALIQVGRTDRGRVITAVQRRGGR